MYYINHSICKPSSAQGLLSSDVYIFEFLIAADIYQNKEKLNPAITHERIWAFEKQITENKSQITHWIIFFLKMINNKIMIRIN